MISLCDSCSSREICKFFDLLNSYKSKISVTVNDCIFCPKQQYVTKERQSDLSDLSVKSERIKSISSKMNTSCAICGTEILADEATYCKLCNRPVCDSCCDASIDIEVGSVVCTCAECLE